MATPAPKDFRAEILASPAYQERVNNLFELFCASRQKDLTPNSILAIQAVLAKLLMDWQQKQREFKSADEQLGIAVVRRLILVLQRIANSIAWRSLGNDKVLIQLLAEHSKTGFLDNTVFTDFEVARQIIEKDGAIVIVNDLTTTLRYGDLTAIYPNKHTIEIFENKLGNGSRQSGHTNRQKKYIESLLAFLNTGTRISREKTRDYLIRVDVPIQTHHDVAADAIKRAMQDGYCRTIVNDCFAIEAVNTKHPNAYFPKERPFADVEHKLSQGNLNEGIFEKTTSRIAPYGIFPFDDRTCFDLITGNVQLVATMNFDALIGLFTRLGLTLELPRLTQEEFQAYLLSPIAKKMEFLKKSRSSWFFIRDGNTFIRISPDNWGRVLLELVHEDTMAQAYKLTLAQMKDRHIAEDGSTRIYMGYKNEASIWL